MGVPIFKQEGIIVVMINEYPTYGEIDKAPKELLNVWWLYLREPETRLEQRKWYYIKMAGYEL